MDGRFTNLFCRARSGLEVAVAGVDYCSRRGSSVAMGPAEGLLTGPTADTQALRWESVRVPLRDLGSALVGMGAPQHGAPDAGLSIRGLALTELAHITISAGNSKSDPRKAHRNPAKARENRPNRTVLLKL